jgi:hypothetical protein
MTDDKMIPMSEAQAMVAAALEEAVKACERAAYDGMYSQDDMVELGCLRSRDYIRAIIPAAGTALNRALTDASEEGRREEREAFSAEQLASILKRLRPHVAAASNMMLAHEIAAAIRARGEV